MTALLSTAIVVIVTATLERAIPQFVQKPYTRFLLESFTSVDKKHAPTDPKSYYIRPHEWEIITHAIKASNSGESVQGELNDAQQVFQRNKLESIVSIGRTHDIAPTSLIYNPRTHDVFIAEDDMDTTPTAKPGVVFVVKDKQEY